MTSTEGSITSCDRSTLDPDYRLSQDTMSGADFDLGVSDLEDDWDGDMHDSDQEAGVPARDRGDHRGSPGRVVGQGGENVELNPDLMDPHDYLESRKNKNTKRNIENGVATYNRVMTEFAQKYHKLFLNLDDASIDDLPSLLEKFFQIAKKVNGDIYSSNSIVCFHSSIANHLSHRKVNPIDIKKDVRFTTVNDMVRTSAAASAEAGRGTGVDAKRCIKPIHLRMALEKGTIGRDNPHALSTAVYLGLTLGMGCRSVKEIHGIKNDDIIAGPRDKNGLPQWFELAERITKTRTGKVGDSRILEPKVFPDHENPNFCYIRSFMVYMGRKTRAQSNPKAPFMLNAKQSAVKNPEKEQFWYIGTGEEGSGIMGDHTLEKLVTNAMTKAGVDCKLEKYSAISTRKCLMQSGVDCGVPDVHISRLAGHKSVLSKGNYIASKGNAHQASVRVIQRKMFSGKDCDYSSEFQKLEEQDVVEKRKPRSRSRKKRRDSSKSSSKSSSRGSSKVPRRVHARSSSGSRRKVRSRSRSRTRARSRSGSRRRVHARSRSGSRSSSNMKRERREGTSSRYRSRSRHERSDEVKTERKKAGKEDRTRRKKDIREPDSEEDYEGCVMSQQVTTKRGNQETTVSIEKRERGGQMSHGGGRPPTFFPSHANDHEDVWQQHQSPAQQNHRSPGQSPRQQQHLRPVQQHYKDSVQQQFQSPGGQLEYQPMVNNQQFQSPNNPQFQSPFHQQLQSPFHQQFQSPFHQQNYQHMSPYNPMFQQSQSPVSHPHGYNKLSPVPMFQHSPMFHQLQPRQSPIQHNMGLSRSMGMGEGASLKRERKNCLMNVRARSTKSSASNLFEEELTGSQEDILVDSFKPKQVRSMLLDIFSCSSSKWMTGQERENLFWSLQKKLTTEVSTISDRPILTATVNAIFAIIQSNLRRDFIAALTLKTDFSTSLFQLMSVALAKPDLAFSKIAQVSNSLYANNAQLNSDL